MNLSSQLERLRGRYERLVTLNSAGTLLRAYCGRVLRSTFSPKTAPPLSDPGPWMFEHGSPTDAASVSEHSAAAQISRSIFGPRL